MASTLNSSLELSRRLTAAGHEVVYVSHVDIRERVGAHGYQFVKLVECQGIRQQLRNDLVELNKQRSPFRFLKSIAAGREARKKSLGSDEICRVIKEISPSVILIDFEMHYAIAATHKLKIPTLLTAVWFTIFRAPGLPPMHTELFPSNHFVDRIRIEFAWWRLILGRLTIVPLNELLNLRRIKKRFLPVQYETNQTADLKAISKAQGFPYSRLVSKWNWSNPYTYVELPLLIFNAIEMELPHRHHPLEHYVGPMVCQERAEQSQEEAGHEEWQSFVESVKEEDRKLVYCSLGTFWSTNKSFLLKVIQTFAKRSDWALVVGLGGKVDREELTHEAPSNVLVLNYAPQLQILEHCDAAITHGGITTINECIFLGVPMLTCQTGFVDQPGCGVRLQYHGLGRSLDMESATPSGIEKELENLMSNQKIQQNVDSMREVFREYAANRVAVQLIESYTKKIP